MNIIIQLIRLVSFVQVQTHSDCHHFLEHFLDFIFLAFIFRHFLPFIYRIRHFLAFHSLAFFFRSRQYEFDALYILMKELLLHELNEKKIELPGFRLSIHEYL